MNTVESPPLPAVLARLIWMAFGPLLLALLAIQIATGGGGWWTAADVAFLATLGVTLLARWVEFRSGRGLTSTGEPLTAEAFRRGVAGTAFLGLAVWAAANVVGNHWPGL